MVTVRVIETSDEETYQLFITSVLKTDSYEYLLDSQPLYETETDSEKDRDAILLFMAHAEDVAEELNATYEVGDDIKEALEELREDIKVSDEKTMKRCSD